MEWPWCDALFIWGAAMLKPSDHAAAILAAAPPLPLSARQWEVIVKAMRLSKREATVAELVLRDLGNKEIAAVMGISHKTVGTYLDTRIPKKTGARGRMQLATHVLAVALRVCPRLCREDNGQSFNRQEKS